MTLKNQIFLSYATPDREKVNAFYDYLSNRGFNVWMDYKKLMPGQNWDFEIKQGFRDSQIILVFVSNNSVSRRSYLQREMRMALDILDEKLIDDIYLIPVLLEENVELPDQLRKIQAVKASDNNCLEMIEQAVIFQLSKLGTSLSLESNHSDEQIIKWLFKTKQEKWEGLPGYEVKIKEVELRSDFYKNINEINLILQSKTIEILHSCRSVKLSQSPDVFNFGQDPFKRTDTYELFFDTPYFRGKVVSLLGNVDWYGAGAAHNNYSFITYVFALEPLFRLDDLNLFFKEPIKDFATLQSLVRHQLSLEEDSDIDWIHRGTESWDSFSAFMFNTDSLDIYFPPYQVDCFAAGTKKVSLPYNTFAYLLKPEYIDLLQVWYDANNPAHIVTPSKL